MTLFLCGFMGCGKTALGKALAKRLELPLVDMDDLIFYEVAMEKRDDDAYLVTGNQKHYPIRDFIVTPAEMMEIICMHKGKI